MVSSPFAINLKKKYFFSQYARTVGASRLVRGSLLGFLLFAQIGCASRLSATDDMRSVDKFGKIKQSLSAIRGLSFTQGIPIGYETKDAMRKYLEADLIRDSGEENFKDIARAYVKLGLFPKGIDLKNTLLKLYAGRVAGFYDLREKKVVLPKSYYFVESGFDENALVHELTHALQDQHFSLGHRLGLSRNGDKTLAFRALAEGDALLTEFAYLHGGLDKGFSASVSQILQSNFGRLQSALSDVPAAVSEKLLFQYKAGASLVYRVLKDKGWPGVDLLYSSPPLSTKQVLHPEKYLELPDPPTEIELEDRASVFPADWKEIENNTLGELMVRCLFKRFFPEGEANRVASGWAGDRFVTFRRGEEISLIWVTVWDSSGDAREFFRKYEEILSRKYRGSETDGLKTYIEQRDQRVVVVEGLDRDRVKKNIEKIWQGMQLAKEAFKPSLLLGPAITDASDQNHATDLSR